MNVYTIVDVQGMPHDLAPGVDFSSYVQRIDTPDESAHFDAPIGAYVLYAVQLAYAALDGYGDQLLARWKITRTVVADPPPPTVRPELPKSTVTSRVDAIGKLPGVWAVLNSQVQLFVLWFSPDWPNVYCDDANLFAALNAAGLTGDEIAQVTAPIVD